jgi:predicted transglutaminase-like cysteine proteinase
VHNFSNIPQLARNSTFRQRFTQLSRRLLPAATLVLWLGFAVADLNFANLQQQLIARFGPARKPLLDDWQALLSNTRTQPEAEKLKRFNDFFNRNIAFGEDISIWGQTDYWATPLETIGRGAGDCEDFAIVKYYSLRQVGVPVSKMRLIYVKARQGSNQRAHMVLAYYASPSAEPLVLDNLDPAIKPASKRQDLTPVFSFNSQGIYAGVSGNAAASPGGTGKLSRWEDLLQRARAEGFE